MDWQAIIGIIAGTLIPAITASVIAIINATRKKNCDNPKCCITGRKLKPKKKSHAKSKG